MYTLKFKIKLNNVVLDVGSDTTELIEINTSFIGDRGFIEVSVEDNQTVKEVVADKVSELTSYCVDSVSYSVHSVYH